MLAVRLPIGWQSAMVQEAVALFETAISFMECVVPPIALAQQKAGIANCNKAVMVVLEQLLQQLLALKVTDTVRGMPHTRAMEAFPPLVAMQPQLAPVIINKASQHRHDADDTMCCCSCPHALLLFSCATCQHKSTRVWLPHV